MRRFALLVAGLALAGVAAAVSGGGTQAQARWAITDLGTLGGENSDSDAICDLRATAINDRGQIVGSSNTRNGGQHAFLWEKGRMRDLGVLHPGWESDATGINQSGQIVGSSWTYNNDGYEVGFQALRWDRGTMQVLAGGRVNQASAITNRGQIVGWVDSRRQGDPLGYAVPRAALWQGGTMRDLGTVHGYWAASMATAISDGTQVIGMMSKSGVGNEALDLQDPIRGFLWQNGRTRDLGVLGQWGEINGINDHGQIVAAKSDRKEKMHAFVWERGSWRRLPDRGTESEALDINDRGQIVGWVGTHAALWENGRLTRLPGLPRRRGAAVACGINDHGQIVGWAEKEEGNQHAVLWTLKRS